MTRSALLACGLSLALPGLATGTTSPAAETAAAAARPAPPAAPLGYYRQPSLRGETIVFVSEGDLWRVSARGGVAARLTTDAAGEGSPAISPDGTTVAFVARYDGPAEVYTMPLAGGPPMRHTWQASSGGGTPTVAGWTKDGRVLYATTARSTLPSVQLETLDPASGSSQPIPLAQAADGAWNEAGTALYFTRLPFQGSHTKRYRGGTVQQIWRWDGGAAEAVLLTGDYPGTSKGPMVWNERVYFLSDRDGTMNLWSMTGDGKDLRQHTKRSWEIAEASLDAGRIAFRSGADLFLFDIAAGTETPLAITLGSDLDQTRERTVKDPLTWTTSAHLSPDGKRVVLTARGQVFVAPVGPGRFVEASRRPGVRFRDARFLPDGKSLVALSDESGEVELWTLPANGVGDARQVTRGGEVLRWIALPSPDGKRIAHTDKNQRLWITDQATGATRKLEESAIADIEDLAWSPDGRWLAAAVPGDNLNRRVKLYPVEGGAALFATTDRYDSSSPAFSADGKWLAFLSERNLNSLVPGPWGLMQPEPYFDKTTRVYLLALAPDLRSPFEPADELHPPAEKKEVKDANRENGEKRDKTEKGEQGKSSGKRSDGSPEVKPDTPPPTTVDPDGLAARLLEVPVPPGNFRGLFVTEKALYWLSSTAGERAKADLQALEITNEKPEVKTVLAGVLSAEPSADGKKLLVRKDDALYVFDAAAAPVTDLDKKKVDLTAFTLPVDPREEWRQMFNEAWRLERDYFYDQAMHGIDWSGMKARYLPLVDRVHSRAELSDLLAQMVSEVEALHTFVYGGDARKGDVEPAPAFLGARLARDPERGGLVVESIYRSDPDRPELASPLARPGVDVKPGDVILAIDGVATLSSPDPGALLRAKAGRQVLLSVKPAGGGAPREVIVQPLTPDDDADRRYHEWEYTRRLRTDEASGSTIGYVHLRAMGGDDYSAWARDYYPSFTRQGLIIDVRHNRGGNIDSWILSRLLRRAWFYWSQRAGRAPSWNMQYAFRGHVVVLVDEGTSSDGEAFAEGFRRLELGPVLGTRTWGGEIWLSSSNVLVDRGIATAAEYGVFGPEGTWLIEGHGVEPDVVVDNLPRATWDGKDAQLEAAIALLRKKIAEDPRPLPPVPPLPRKGLPAR